MFVCNFSIASRSPDIRTDLISSDSYTWWDIKTHPVAIITHSDSLGWCVWSPVRWSVWPNLPTPPPSNWVIIHVLLFHYLRRMLLGYCRTDIHAYVRWIFHLHVLEMFWWLGESINQATLSDLILQRVERQTCILDHINKQPVPIHWDGK